MGVEHPGPEALVVGPRIQTVVVSPLAQQQRVSDPQRLLLILQSWLRLGAPTIAGWPGGG